MHLEIPKNYFFKLEMEKDAAYRQLLKKIAKAV